MDRGIFSAFDILLKKNVFRDPIADFSSKERLKFFFVGLEFLSELNDAFLRFAIARLEKLPAGAMKKKHLPDSVVAR